MTNQIDKFTQIVCFYGLYAMCFTLYCDIVNTRVFLFASFPLLHFPFMLNLLVFSAKNY